MIALSLIYQKEMTMKNTTGTAITFLGVALVLFCLGNLLVFLLGIAITAIGAAITKFYQE